MLLRVVDESLEVEKGSVVHDVHVDSGSGLMVCICLYECVCVYICVRVLVCISTLVFRFEKTLYMIFNCTINHEWYHSLIYSHSEGQERKQI